MKKMFKRFFTLVMALVMALSCTVVASAAEIPEEDSDVAITAAVQPREVGNLGVPFTSKDTVATGRNYVEGSFYLEKEAYVLLSLANYDKCTLEVTGTWSIDSRAVPASTSARTMLVWGDKAPKGLYYYKLSFPSSNSVFAGRFLWSDNK